jgi:hypothetical protein
MKKVFLLLLIFITYQSFGQSIPCQKVPQTLSHIGKIRAFMRQRVYNRKNRNLKKHIGYKEITSISYSPNAFLDILMKVTDTSSHYDGLRVYYAVYPKTSNDIDSSYISIGMNNRFTLIYVPTIWADSSKEHLDDLKNCWIIKNNEPNAIAINLTDPKQTDFISKWIWNYDTTRWNFLNIEGSKHTRRNKVQFQETKSMWYDAGFLKHNDSNSGLIDYLNYFMCKKKINTVRIKFTGYALRTYTFSDHLSLVFNFYKNKKRDDISTINIAPSYDNYLTKEVNSKSISSGNTDTGVPCPPYPQGQTKCPGSLPQ